MVLSPHINSVSSLICQSGSFSILFIVIRFIPTAGGNHHSYHLVYSDSLEVIVGNQQTLYTCPSMLHSISHDPQKHYSSLHEK